jgi:putative pyruvate formate lyase activating enzyme
MHLLFRERGSRESNGAIRLTAIRDGSRAVNARQGLRGEPCRRAAGYPSDVPPLARQPLPPDPGFLLEDFEPVYLETWRRGELPGKVEAGLAELASCEACPRNCRIDRLKGERRVCHTGRHAIVSSAFPHFGEEDCLRGWNGSGTIFFGMCNLRCVFCQNWDISQREKGRELDAEAIAELALQLQARGCHNVNFVTPEHVAPQVAESLAVAIPGGLRVPVVYNTSAFDALASLRLMDGLVDIYMPDFKFWRRETARRLCKAKNYPEVARDAIREMHHQVGDLRFAPDGIARRGLLVRHLVMPGQIDETAAIMRWLAEEISPDTYVNIMGQYSPNYEVGQIARDGSPKYGEIDRRPTRPELEDAYAVAREAGLWRFDVRAA